MINSKKDNKIKLFGEEKNSIINNFFEKEKEFNYSKSKTSIFY